MTAAKIRALGISELERIREDIQVIITALDFDGDFRAFVTFCAKNRDSTPTQTRNC